VARYLGSMNVHTPKPNKYKAYRERKKAAGLKQVRVWTLDKSAPGFLDEIRESFERTRGTQEERDIREFLDAAMRETWGSLPE
jgi:hypothetical protein